MTDAIGPKPLTQTDLGIATPVKDLPLVHESPPISPKGGLIA